MSPFVPRTSFPWLASLPRSYFLGHHNAGLQRMGQLVSGMDLVIECRDYRAPISSRNPLFEETLGEKPRLIVYTKSDLGSYGTPADRHREEIIREWYRPTPVLFHSHASKTSTRGILEFAREHAASANKLTGSRMMVVGMPNVGKSTLLNALRLVSLGKKKAAATGAQPGVTRKIGTGVKIIEGGDDGGGVYLSDTPGVFIPYVADNETMLKLALCGSVKDTIIPPTTLADYLLYQMNRNSPSLYKDFSAPTNEINEFLQAMATKIGRLQKGGTAEVEATALWCIQRWRKGLLGRMVLDEVTEDALDWRKDELVRLGGSLHQARREAKSARMKASRQRSQSVETM